MATGRLLIILPLIGCLITSCLKEVITVIPKEEDKASTISLRIHLSPEVNTRSGWTYDEYFPSATPTTKESEVSNILLVIFKNTLLEEYALYETEGSGGDFSYNKNSGIITLHKTEEGENEIDLEPGIHYFYVVLNLPDGLYQQIEPQLENGIFSLARETFEKQLMNVNFEYLTGEGTDGNGFIMTNSNPPDYHMIYSDTQCEELGVSNQVAISVGRALAKVSLAYVPSKTGELHGSLKDIRYKTVNHPSRMYLMPVKENGILVTPHYHTSASNGFLYPAKNVLEDGRGWLNATTQKLINDTDADFDYCIENNVKTHLKSNSTGLLIRAKFEPAIWLNANGTEGAQKETDGTFWRIVQYDNDGYLLTYTKGYYNEPPDSICQSLGNDFRIRKYEGGICYYAFWLTTNEEHLVKRNDFHKVVITHIHGAGAPDINDIINPDIDPDPKPTWGRLAVSAMGWDDYTQIEIIGEEPIEDNDSSLNPNVQDWEKGNDQHETLEGGDSNNKFN